MPSHTVMTPEMVTLRFQVAGLFTRAMAFLFDTLMMFLACFAALLLVSIGGANAITITLSILIPFSILLGYFTVLETYMHGQTPGKRIMGLRVMDAAGRRLTFDAVLIRNMVRFLDYVPAMMFLGGSVAAADPLHRRIGDFAAHTIVIRHRRTALPTAVTHQKKSFNSFHSDSNIRSRILERITVDERDLIIDMVLRRDGMDIPSREALFAQAAEYFQIKLAIPAQQREHLSDEQYILNLAMVLQEDWFKG